MPSALIPSGFESLNRLVEKLFDQSGSHRFNLLLMPRFRPRQSSEHPCDFQPADSFHLFAQGGDRWNDLQVAQPIHELAHLRLDNRLRFVRLFAAALEIAGDDALQIVDIIEVDIGDVADFGFDIARNRNIDEEKGAVPGAWK